MRALVIVAIVLTAAATALCGWLLGAAAHGAGPHGDYHPRQPEIRVISGPRAELRRREIVRAATPRVLPGTVALQPAPALPPGHPLAADRPACRFLAEQATGTSAKFSCVLEGGEVIKVKYGRNAEIHSEAAATQLLARLGYAADQVIVLPRLRCYGCPRYPFFTMRLLTLASATGILAPNGYALGYTDFDWVAVERRFPAAAIETAAETGWAWWELEDSRAPVAEIDAFRLLAVFLAHWDNKADNQRLVCPEAAAAGACERPVLMIQDVGATFGPAKANLAPWRDLPVWADRDTCLVSMRGLPSHGATFPDVHISEAGRALLAQRLAGLSDDDVRTIFASARFPAFYPGTSDERDLDAWTAAFRLRVSQITDARPCP